MKVSGPTQSATMARQYAEKIQQFGEKNVIRKARRRNHNQVKNGYGTQKDSMLNADNSTKKSMDSK